MLMAARVLSPVGGVLVGLGVFVPYQEGFSILDFDEVGLTSVGFALEPLVVALVSFAPVVLVGVAPRLTAIVVATAGAQIALMYVGYLLLAIDNSNVRFGAVIGLFGAGLMLVAGVLGLVAPESGIARAVAPTETASLAPAGWYPDPTGTSSERFWDGAAWTEAVR